MVVRTTSTAAAATLRGCQRIIGNADTTRKIPLLATVGMVSPNITLTTTNTQQRNLSSSKQGNLQNYLDVWVGSNPSTCKKIKNKTPPSSISQSSLQPKTTTTQNLQQQQQQQQQQPVRLSASSYLMPTLRLERGDTAESLRIRISAALESSNTTTTTIVRSMLSGKESSTGQVWRVPIILDTSALVPDGSPHYVPPPLGLLTNVYNTLDTNFGIRIVGISNPPPTMEQEAMETLGLPSIMSKSRALDRQKDSKFRIEDVVRLVVQQLEDKGGMTPEEIDAAIQQQQEKDNDEAAAAAAAEAEAAAMAEAEAPEVEVEEPLVNQGNPNDDDEETSSSQSPPIQVPEPVLGETKVYRGSVRSGQQVAADKNQSLIIMGQVNPGGEVLADGDIYVFGKLRGRALAGLASGNTTTNANNARIFASSFDPELVCVGDSFTTIDDVEEELGLRPGGPAMASLNEDGELIFESVSL